jgi:hypothetical protein
MKEVKAWYNGAKLMIISIQHGSKSIHADCGHGKPQEEMSRTRLIT